MERYFELADKTPFSAAYITGDEHGIYFIAKGDGTDIAEGTSVSMDMKSQIKDKIAAGPYTATYCIQGMVN